VSSLELSEEVKERARKIRLVIVDNDGVMTDGRIVYGDHGDELKFFDVQDGFGLVLLNRAGYVTVMISGKKSSVNKRRAKDLQFSNIYQNSFDKLAVFEKASKKHKVRAEEICYIGDDLIDLPPMKRAGFAVAVPDAVDEVLKTAHYVTARRGGHGAVREVVDILLKTQGQWTEVTSRYFR
jgi:3-deoxy-D-manno-octulosonate 8-phosphate phosphatase (KDO 8-P phosphatase)